MSHKIGNPASHTNAFGYQMMEFEFDDTKQRCKMTKMMYIKIEKMISMRLYQNDSFFWYESL